MNFGWVGGEYVTKRLPESRDTVNRILSYGGDNLYPQRMEEVYLLSPLTKSAVNLVASFIRGDGFENGDVEINEAGETANDLLRLIANDQALFNGYAIHINSTGLGLVNDITHIPFSFVRLGLPNQKGRIKYVRVSNNWEGENANILPENKLDDKSYLLYDSKQAALEAIRTGRGMVYYSTPKKYCYPLSTLDPIIETAHSDNEIQKFELGNLTNGFLSMSVFKYPSSGNTEDEEAELSKKLNEFKGARNANSILVAAIDEDWEGSGPLVEQIPANNNDTLFTQTTQNIRQRVIQNYNVPPALLGILPEGSIFTAQELADSYVFMNLRTKDIRNQIEREFKKLGIDVGGIIPNEFESSQMKNNDGNTTGNAMDNPVGPGTVPGDQS